MLLVAGVIKMLTKIRFECSSMNVFPILFSCISALVFFGVYTEKNKYITILPVTKLSKLRSTTVTSPDFAETYDGKEYLIHDRFYFGENMKDAYERMGWVKHPDLVNCYQAIDRHKTIHCVPKLYIICCPRSGSTSMRGMLATHNGVVLHKASEDHYWMSYQSKKLPEGQFNWEHTQLFVLKTWMKQFSSQDYQMATVEEKRSMMWVSTTPEYWYQSIPICSYQNRWKGKICDEFTTPPYDIIPRSLRYWFPKMKFVIMARHPADRTYSHWSAFFNYVKFCGNHNLPTYKNPACFHQYVLEFSKEWSRCLEENGEEECSVWPRRKWGNGDFLRSIMISFHDVHAHLWLRYFPPEQFHFVSTELMDSDFNGEIGLLANYTGLDAAGFNSSRTHANRGRPRMSMWPETRLLLEALYRPHIKRTCRMLPQTCRFVDLWYDQHIKLASGEWKCERVRNNTQIWHKDCEQNHEEALDLPIG